MLSSHPTPNRPCEDENPDDDWRIHRSKRRYRTTIDEGCSKTKNLAQSKREIVIAESGTLLFDSSSA